ncbi:MAG TPA: hypothetical protein PK006_05055 [Saprospiraceae bacterium]|nr:hypothetical protein [Saprospiraceae bacterium]
MKNLIFPGLFFLLLFCSCEQQEEGQFTMEQSLQFTIQAGLNPLLTHVYEWNPQSPLHSFLAQNQLTKDQIKKITVREVYLEPVLSGPISYRFLESVKALISDPSKPLLEFSLGEVMPLANESVGNLQMLPGLADMKPYLILDRNTVKIELRLRELITTSFAQRLVIKYSIFTQ